MKIFKSSKLLALILAISLCLGAMSVISFAADDSAPVAAEAKKPEIISQNVKYGGNFSLMFAVDADSCSGSTVTLKVYNEEPAEETKAIWSQTVTAGEELTTVNGTPCYVFITAGVAAKDMDKSFYVVAESDGVKSDVKEYSVAEYLYERLYGDQIAFALDAIGKAQADLYKSVLQMGKNAQELLFNHDDNPDNDRTTFVTDLYYVAAASGINGAHGTINGTKKGVLTDGTEELSFATDYTTKSIPLSWDIRYIDKDGNVSAIRNQQIDKITPTSHMIITPSELVTLPDSYDMENISSFSSSYFKTGNSKTTFVSIDEFNGSRAAKVSLEYTGSYYEFYNGIIKTETNPTHIVYDTDISFNPVFREGKTSAYLRFQFTGKSVNGSSCKAYTIYLHAYSNGTRYVSTSSGTGGTKVEVTGDSVHLRVIYRSEVVDGVKKMVADTYVNGEYFNTVTSAMVYTNSTDGITANDVSDITWVSIVPETAGCDTGSVIYQDNITFAKLAKYTVANTLSDSGRHEIDGLKEIPASFASGSTASIVDYNGSSAIKFDMTSSNDEKLNFYTQSVAENADKFIFEADISDFHPARSIIAFYDANGTKLYNIYLNGFGAVVTENNGVFWGNGIYAQSGTTNIRIELSVVDGKLDVNIYSDGKPVARPSDYGSNWDLAGCAVPMSTIARVEISDASNDAEDAPDGYIIFDNIKVEAIKTTN